jgi:hypothetical protein
MMNHPLTPERSVVNTPKAYRQESTSTATAKRKPHTTEVLEFNENIIDEDDAVVDLLRSESSPIYSSRPSSTLGKRGSIGLHAPSSPVCDPFGFWVDVERNLRFMDQQNDANFTEWIRNEQNLGLSLPHLKRVMFDYGIDRIINGLKWLIYEWRLASIATTIKYLLIDDLWLNANPHPTDFDLAHYLSVAGRCYSVSKAEFKNRVRIIMALVDGWNFEHVRELFHFICTASCITTGQSTFLLQALLLAFPEASLHAKKLKRRLIESFLFN